MAARAVRFAVLQAMGLRGREVIGIVTVEYALTLLYGILLGTGLGVLASRLYVPFFAVTENPSVPIPPFIPYIDWEKAAWMAAVMGASLMLIELGVLWRASRARIFEVLRLGLRE
jgi:putative ABC transport system permease protein